MAARVQAFIALIASLFLFASSLPAANPANNFDFHWAQTIAGTGDQQANGVAVDPFGQIHVTGYFVGATDFHGASITNVGLFDLFVARYRPSGDLIWAKSLGGPNQDVGLGIAADAQGNTIVAGYFQIGALLGGIKLTNAGSTDALVMKLNPAGAVSWTRSIGGPGDERAYAVATDTEGNVYAVGHFQANAKFNGQTLTHRGEVDLFLVKYDADGNFAWVRSAGSGNADVAYSVAVDDQHHVWVVGYFSDQAQFETTTLPSAGNADLFLAQYSTNGDLNWVRSAGGTEQDVANSVAATPDGGAVIAGVIRGQVSFGTKIISGTGPRTFVARYSSSGDLVWIQVSNGSDARSVAWADGGVYLVGHFIGSMPIGSETLVSAGNFDVFVVRYNSDSTPEWARSFGGPNLDYGYSISGDAQKGCLIAGRFTDTVSLDRLSLTSQGNGDAYVTKLSPTPFLSLQPSGLTALPGTDAILKANAVGAPPIRYQWLYNQTNLLESATSNQLSLIDLDPIQTGLYSVVASNSFGSVTSAPAFLNVFGLPRPTVKIRGIAGTQFGLTNQTSAPFELFNPVLGTQIYYSIDGTRPTFASLLYTNPVVITQSVVLRATAYNAAFTASEMTPVPITFFLSAPRVLVDGKESTSLSFTNRTSLRVQIAPPMEGVRLFYSMDGSDPTTNAIVSSNAIPYRSPFVITQSMTLKASAYRPGFTGIISDPVSVRFVQEYNLELEPTLDGLIARHPEGPNYLAGTTVQLTAEPALGWGFLNWTLDATGDLPQVSVVMDSTKRVGALFGTALTTTPIGNGRIVIDPVLPLYPRGGSFRASAVPDKGHYFALWGGIATGNMNPMTIKVSSPVPTLSALFSPLPDKRYSLTVVQSGSGTTEITPVQVFYDENATVSVQAVADEGWRFSGWEGDIVSSTNPLPVVMKSSYLINAKFIAQEFIELQSPQYGLGFHSFLLRAPIGKTYQIQRSPDYTNWQVIQTLTNTMITTLISNSIPTPPPQFLLYRAFLPQP